MRRAALRVVPAIVVSVVFSIVATKVGRRLFQRPDRPTEGPAAELRVFASAEGAAEVARAYRSVLALWPVPYVEREIPTSFGLTHVIESGPADASPVVLLHAYFATAASWYRTVGELSEQHRVYAVDVIGDANLSRPVRPITSMGDYLTWFVELLDGMGVTTVSLVGNSFGGFLATHFAIELADRVSKLVLIGPGSTFRRMPAFYIRMFAPKAAYLLLPWLPGRARAMRACEGWMYAGLPRDPAWSKLFNLVLLHGGTANQVFPRVFTRDELARIRASVLLILGDRERIYRAEDASDAARALLPSIQVQIVPNAHHVTAIAQPKLVNAALLRFLDGAQATGATERRARHRRGAAMRVQVA
ncbi:MAG TPA: alpha/beta fold hydrolase [Candidatus Limnocylindria bacterium]|jgi:pimeloyl-ACP methyl ester carboxylesterase